MIAPLRRRHRWTLSLLLLAFQIFFIVEPAFKRMAIGALKIKCNHQSNPTFTFG